MGGVLEGAELNMCLVEHPPNHSTAACGWCASMSFTATGAIRLYVRLTMTLAVHNIHFQSIMDAQFNRFVDEAC